METRKRYIPAEYMAGASYMKPTGFEQEIPLSILREAGDLFDLKKNNLLFVHPYNGISMFTWMKTNGYGKVYAAVANEKELETYNDFISTNAEVFGFPDIEKIVKFILLNKVASLKDIDTAFILSDNMLAQKSLIQKTYSQGIFRFNKQFFDETIAMLPLVKDAQIKVLVGADHVYVFQLPVRRERNEFQEFVRKNIVSLAVPDDPILQDELSRLEVWLRAFAATEANLGYDYETLETLGDRILESRFMEYLYKKFRKPGAPAYEITLTPQNLTDLRHHWVATESLASIAKNLGCAPYVKTVGKVTDKTLEDVFEAIVGAIHTGLETLNREALCDVATKNFCFNIFATLDIRVDASIDPYKTHVLEMYRDGMKWGQNTGNRRDIIPIQDHMENEYIVVTLFYTKKAMDELKALGYTVSNVMGVGKALIRKDAERDAFKNAYENLGRMGITPESAKAKGRFDWMTKNPDYQHLKDLMDTRMKELSYRRFDFKEDGSRRDANMKISLYVVDSEGKEIIVDTKDTVRPNVIFTRVLLLTKYLQIPDPDRYLTVASRQQDVRRNETYEQVVYREARPSQATMRKKK